MWVANGKGGIMREIKFKARSLNGEWVFLRLIGSDSHIVELSTIRQYTGLKDKHKKEIYEGDIMLDKNSVVWIVSFGVGSFVATTMGETDCDSLYSVIDKEVEVIGNIYDNPELIKD